jgi:aerobic carbon-monoxide dehydrogenase large subunit
MATARVLGSSIKRREDPRFITGRGNYTDDVKVAGMTHAVFVRSPHANAHIRSIDVGRAKPSSPARTWPGCSRCHAGGCSRS